MAYLIEGMNLGYDDFYQMPYSRRQRLIEWKQSLEKKREQEMESARRTRAR